MEKNLPDKSSSFTRKKKEINESFFYNGEHNHALLESNENDNTHVEIDSEKREDEEIEITFEEDFDAPPEDEHEPESNLLHLSEEIDQFLSNFSDKKDDPDFESESVTPDVPHFVEKFVSLVEAKIGMYESSEGIVKWRQVEEEDTSFLEDVDRLSQLEASLSELRSVSNYASSLIRIGSVLQKAMSFLEEEFRSLLEDSGIPVVQHEEDRCTLPEPVSVEAEKNNFRGYSVEVVSDLNRIAKAMICCGYETECSQVYMIARRHAFEDCINNLGYEKHSIDDVQKMHCDILEREIPTWINTFSLSATVYFPGELSLAVSVFTDYPTIYNSLFSNQTRCVLIQLLNFAEAVAMTKRSSEKLFKFLDMYEMLRDKAAHMEAMFPEECANELRAEISSARSRLGEVIIRIFGELENSIKSDAAKTQVPGGAVHPLTRYTMNYLTYACGYKDTLDQVFKEHHKIERSDSTSGSEYELPSHVTPEMARESPFSVQLMRVMDLLDINLEGKSKMYKDVSLSYIFLMNNGRYILQKIKAKNKENQASEISELIDDTWCRKRSSDLRQYHKNYQRDTWHKILTCLSHEGLNVNGKVMKPALKEKFKSFNMLLEEVHMTQSSWVVSDDQLQSELRVSISALVIPAYRSFLGRFGQVLTSGRQTEKYVKFQSEDVETYIDELFDGNQTSMGKKKP